MNELPKSIVARIKACRTLPTMPGVAMRIVELCRSEDVSLSEVADVLKQDPALSARILRYANGSAVGVRGSVTSVQRASVLLGALTVQTLALSFSLTTSLQATRVGGFDHRRYWRRSLFCAASAQAVAAQLGMPQPEVLFIVGLLQDVGMLVLAHTLGAEYTRVVDDAGPVHEDLVAAEQAALGFDHAAVTAMLAEDWNLPRLFVEGARASHGGAEAHVASTPSVADVIAVSSYLADIFCVGDVALASQRAQAAAHTALGMSRDDLERVLSNTTAIVAAGAELVDVDPGPPEHVAQIFEDARESLLALTVRSSLERQALEDVSLRDPLTRLWNRSHVDRRLDGVFRDARATGTALAVAFCDVDEFKKVNDTYGHAAGDEVLKHVAKRLAAALRESDLVGRYGGEEFVVLLPKTTPRDAHRVCERLREAVGGSAATLEDGRTVRVTVSIGLASMSPATPSATELLKAADGALYVAKRSGRNRVCAA
jgi:diguanylate cyclase (GGDEF)-like protein